MGASKQGSSLRSSLLSVVYQSSNVGCHQLFAEEEMEDNFVRASNEAKAAFGDGGMFIEKYLEDPRHIEIQVRLWMPVGHPVRSAVGMLSALSACSRLSGVHSPMSPT